MFKITFEFKNNKTGENTVIPSGSFKLTRNQGDGYDEVYELPNADILSGIVYLKSGQYTNIKFNYDSEYSDLKIDYYYPDFILDKDKKFTFRYNCETISKVYVLLNDFSNYLEIYDENDNLYLRKDPNQEYNIELIQDKQVIAVGPLSLLNITYTFKQISSTGETITSAQIQLSENGQIIDLRY